MNIDNIVEAIGKGIMAAAFAFCFLFLLALVYNLLNRIAEAIV